jgi:hypothetical protein
MDLGVKLYAMGLSENDGWFLQRDPRCLACSYIEKELVVSQIIDLGMTMEFNEIGSKLGNSNGKVIPKEMRDNNLYRLCTLSGIEHY